MSRGTSSRRRGPRAQTWDEEGPGNEGLIEESERRAGRLDADNARLRDALAEAEGWYRLLQADHATLQARHGQVGRKAAQLQAETARLESKNRELEALVDRPVGPGRAAGFVKKDTAMIRINDGLRALRRHKWASAALIAMATLLARDPGIQGLFSSGLAKVREIGKGDEKGRDPASSGFVLYAGMIQARDEAERARLDYNERESSLKGDALLEAQDHLRAAKARYRQARLAFLPELVRQCEVARLPIPKEARESFASLKQEARE